MAREHAQWMEKTAKPKIVSAGEWQRERDELLTAEKEATRALDALAARRRRLPMVRFRNDYVFDTPEGPGRCLTFRRPGPARRVPVHGPRPGRGMDRLMFVHNILDLCPSGRNAARHRTPGRRPAASLRRARYQMVVSPDDAD